MGNRRTGIFLTNTTYNSHTFSPIHFNMRRGRKCKVNLLRFGYSELNLHSHRNMPRKTYQKNVKKTLLKKRLFLL